MTPEAEQWLAFQVATTYGKDKDTMCDRLTWVAENHDLISRIAKDPIGNRPEWEGVEEPWTFLPHVMNTITVLLNAIVLILHYLLL